MEKIDLIIVTDDSSYGRTLALALQRYHRGFMVKLSSRDAFVRAWRRAGWRFRDGFDLILWDGEDIRDLYGGNLIWLTEQRPPEAGSSGQEQKFRLYKYATASETAAGLFRIYETVSGRKSAGRRPESVRVFSFFSWQGGAGCSTLALAAGREMTRFFGRRVLYLTMDGLEPADRFMTGAEGGGRISQYLYRLFRDSGRKDDPLLEGYLARDEYGLQALAPSLGKNPLPELTGEEMDRLLGALMNSGCCDTLVIDGGDCFTGAALAALSLSDRVAIVGKRWEGGRFVRLQSCLWDKEGKRMGEKPLFLWNGEAADCPQEDGRKWKHMRRSRSGTDPLEDGPFLEDIHAVTEMLCYNTDM